MIQNDYIMNLHNTLKQFNEAIYWLKRSYNKCLKIGIKHNYSEDELDVLETLASRFGRTCDMLIHKVFRSIDKVELEEGGTLIDVVNRAEKRGLIDSVDELRIMKDLRNQIVHEYISEGLVEFFEDIMKYAPKLFGIRTKIEEYCKKY